MSRVNHLLLQQSLIFGQISILNYAPSNADMADNHRYLDQYVITQLQHTYHLNCSALMEDPKLRADTARSNWYLN